MMSNDFMQSLRATSRAPDADTEQLHSGYTTETDASFRRTFSPISFNYREDESFTRSVDLGSFSNGGTARNYPEPRVHTHPHPHPHPHPPSHAHRREHSFISFFSSSSAASRRTSLQDEWEMRRLLTKKLDANKLLQKASLVEDTAMNLALLFWYPRLGFLEPMSSLQIEGYAVVFTKFKDLWPKGQELDNLIESGREILTDAENSNGALLTITLTSLCCPGLCHVLDCLLRKEFLHPCCQIQEGLSLLHLACMADNLSAVELLLARGANPIVMDQANRLPSQVCQDPLIRKILPRKHIGRVPVYQIHPATIKDKEEIFTFSAVPEMLPTVMLMLQVYDFNVNSEFNREGDALIHLAAKGGTLYIPFMEFLSYHCNADINLRTANEDADNALSIAIKLEGKSSLVMVDYLICCLGALVNSPNKKGKTALHTAAAADKLDLVNLLLKRGADCNLENAASRRPDDEARERYGMQSECVLSIEIYRENRIERLKNVVAGNGLLHGGFRQTDVFEVDSDGYTLVMRAAESNALQSLQLLLNATGCPVNAQNPNSGRTALSMAAENDCPEVVRELFKNGASEKIADFKGFLPLHYAAKRNNVEVLETFFDFPMAGFAGLQRAMTFDGLSDDVLHLLKCAFKRRQENLVQKRLFACANGVYGEIDEIVAFLEEGDDLEVMDFNGDWPLYVACRSGRLEVVKALIEFGCGLLTKHRDGSTILHAAASSGQSQLLQYLLDMLKKLQLRVNLNKRDGSGRSPLLLAAKRGSLQSVNLLLKKGASPCVLDEKGGLFYCMDFQGVQCVLEKTRETRMMEIAACIKDKRRGLRRITQTFSAPWDHYLRDQSGLTPLMLACRGGRVQLTKFLLATSKYKLQDEDGVNDAGDDFAKVVNCASWRKDSSAQEPPLSADSGFDRAEMFSSTGRNTRLEIYDGEWISHLCAIQPATGFSPMHFVLQYGDKSPVIQSILETDSSCINVQDALGRTPLHLACLLNRNASTERILLHQENEKVLDPDILTNDGELVDDLAKNSWLKRRIQEYRQKRSLMNDQNEIVSSETEIAFDSVSQAATGGADDQDSTLTSPSVDFTTLNNKLNLLRSDKND